MIQEPPAIYDHAFAGPVVVSDKYGGEISALGGPCYPWMGAKACAVRLNGTCYIFAIKGALSPELLRHETGHCNGWPADHPESRRE